MHNSIKATLALLVCSIGCFTAFTVAQVGDDSIAEGTTVNYIFETIYVPGVDFLEITASNDFGDYAGNTRSPDGEKTIGFTLIDGVFSTFDFPASVNTFFYGLDNAGKAVGHYKDSNGLYHGVVLQDGELTQYDFPGATQTHIYGISDETGALSGNSFDEAGVSRGFSGDMQIEVPGAMETYADFVNAAGVVVGSYLDAAGIPHGYMRNPDGSFITVDIPQMPNLEFLYVNAINDVGVVIFRAKAVDDIPRSYIILPGGEPHELKFPGSVSTVVRNINQDGSIIGNYDSPDGRRHGFVGVPATLADAQNFGNVYGIPLTKGLNMLSVPLKSPTPMTARSLAAMTDSTTVIALDAAYQRFVAWTPTAPDDGFLIEGAKGYIVNVQQPREVRFVGAPWTHQSTVAAAPIGTPIAAPHEAWAFVVSGHLEGIQSSDRYQVTVRNLRTNSGMMAQVRGDYFAAATADLGYRSVVQVGDTLELTVTDATGEIAAETFKFTVTPKHIANAVMSVTLDGIGTPKQTRLFQNYPNPFNPETWIPYHLSEAAPVSISIYDTTGRLVRTLSLGYQSVGFYQSRARAAYWDGRNALGEPVASGVYFYQLATPSFQQTQRMLILK